MGLKPKQNPLRLLEHFLGRLTTDALVDLVWLYSGIGSIAASIYFSVTWLQDNMGSHIVLAVVVGGTYVTFINMLFESGFTMVNRSYLILTKYPLFTKKDKYQAKFRLSINILGGLTCWLVWGILVVYSMASTVGTQYDQLVVKGIEEVSSDEAKQVAKDRADKALLTLLEEEKGYIKAELDSVTKAVSRVDSAEYKYEYRKTYADMTLRKQFLQEKLDSKNEEIKELLASSNLAYTEQKFSVDKGGVFNYFHEFFPGLEPLKIQFYLSVYPSVFLDILAPISLTVFVYRRRNRKKQPKRATR